MKKTCLIYGHNGLDLDVAFNLRSFYKNLGYRTVFGEKLFFADLLVILRAVDKPIDHIQNYDFPQIHVYDYGGWGYDACIKSLDYYKTYIFTTTSKHRMHLVDNLNFPENHVFVAFPPVEIKMWIAKERDMKFNLVHIGNCKFKVKNDIYQDRFDRLIKQFNVDIWGNDWKLKKIKSHGNSGLFAAPKIYSSSNFSLGIMVPFQRNVTFSGRFWQSTLNGCYLISEPGYYTNIIPGVIETNYETENFNKAIHTVTNRNLLKKQAHNFWQKENDKIRSIISSISPKSEKQKSFELLLFIYYFKYAINNYMKIGYQKATSLMTKYKL